MDNFLIRFTIFLWTIIGAVFLIGLTVWGFVAILNNIDNGFGKFFWCLGCFIVVLAALWAAIDD